MIYIQGNGGHARVVRDILRFRPRIEQSDMALVAVGDNAARKKEALRLAAEGYKFATAVSQYAVISSDAVYGEGTVICEGAIIQCGVKIGRHVIINCGAVLTHDVIVEDYAHIAPGVHLCGGVHVGEGALVGVGVAVAPLAKIPPWSLVKTRRLEICPMK